MPSPLSGPGVGLMLPQNLYPSELQNAPYDFSNPNISLAPGDAIPLPAGTWIIDLGLYSILQYLDPCTGVWRVSPSVADMGGLISIKSDGFSVRVANLTGCPVAAIVAGGGSGWVQATAAVASNQGGSTWQPIVGGALSINTVLPVGANYGVPPIVFIPAPPPGGVPASAIAVINAGTISSIQLLNAGAGYPTVPVATILPNPTDPNIGTSPAITQASVNFTLAGTGQITAVLCTNNGASVTSINGVSLTASGGAGINATIVPVVMQTVIGGSLGGGGGFGATSSAIDVTTVGGVPSQRVEAFVNPSIDLVNFRPRQLQANAVSNAGGSLSSFGQIYDGGLFVGIPTALVASNSITSTIASTVGLTMGGTTDTIRLQPGP